MVLTVGTAALGDAVSGPASDQDRPPDRPFINIDHAITQLRLNR